MIRRWAFKSEADDGETGNANVHPRPVSSASFAKKSRLTETRIARVRVSIEHTNRMLLCCNIAHESSATRYR